MSQTQTVWLLACARCLPVAWVIPGFAGGASGLLPRLFLGLALAVLAGGPAAAASVRGRDPGTLLVAHELLVGLVLAGAVAVLFRAAELAGWLADRARGGGASTEGDAPMVTLYALLSAIAFLTLGGPAQVTVALARSYEAFPPGGTAAPSVAGMLTTVVRSSTLLLETALGLAAPVLVAFLLGDVVLRVLARVLPLPAARGIAEPARGLLGLGTLLLGLGGLQLGLTIGLRGWADWLATTVGLWR